MFPTVMEKFLTVQDFESHALSILPPEVKNVYLGASGAQRTTRLNKEAYERFRICPKVLRDVSLRDISTTVLGERVSMPLGVSPMAHQKTAHPDGELANARGAEAEGVVFIHSNFSNHSIQEIGKAAPKAIKWQQLAIHKDRDCTRHIVRRAEEAGFKAIVVTVDYPLLPKSKNGHITLTESATFKIYKDYYLSKNPKEDLGDLFDRAKSMIDDSLTWKDIVWLKSTTKLPVVVKGVLTAKDALAAVNHGANAIIVSNHGGRQLESPPTTIEALSEIAAAVGNNVEVYVDGGIRHGTDIFKALALGAKMVFIGRPMLWGLACGGENGARALLDTFRYQLDETFALAGCRSVEEVTRDSVRHVSSFSHL